MKQRLSPYLLVKIVIIIAVTFLVSDQYFLFGSGETIRFAVIGDFGSDNKKEANVAALVKSWNPDFVITTGDNNYQKGRAKTIDKNIGKYYSDFIGNYKGKYGTGSEINMFFPSLGNHDWKTEGAEPYLNYFTLPGNERYYSFNNGPIEIFILDSDTHEPDGIKEGSVQYDWFRSAVAKSNASWKFVAFHHAPFNSCKHEEAEYMRWPFSEWGIDAIFSGHCHNYERINHEGIQYFINGAGGQKDAYKCINRSSESKECYVANNGGAQLVTVTNRRARFDFFGVGNSQEPTDSVTVKKFVRF